MYTRALVKKLILPSISIGVVRAEGKEDDCDTKKKLIRPRDLPLYVETPKCVNCSNAVESEDGFLLTTVRCVRQELQTVLEQAKVIQAEANSMMDNIKKETSEAVSYLQQEENLLPRMGAIGVGALAGYLLAVRKGIIKKMLYSATGAGLIAAIAYPNEAKEYTEEVLCELKKYAVIGYHFVNGADVDWKKLKAASRPPCFGKNGNSKEGSAAGQLKHKSSPKTATNSLANDNTVGDSKLADGTNELSAGDDSGSPAEAELADIPVKKKSYRAQCRERGGFGKRKSCDPKDSSEEFGCRPVKPRSKAGQSAGNNGGSCLGKTGSQGGNGSGASGPRQSNGNGTYGSRQSNGGSAYESRQSNGDNAYESRQSDGDSAYESRQNNGGNAYESKQSNGGNAEPWSDGSRRPYGPSGPAGCGPL